MESSQNPNDYFEPNYLIHPGRILEGVIKQRGMKQVDLSQKCGITEKALSEIINGKKLISIKTAIALERALGVEADFWCNLVTNYKLHKARIEDLASLEADIVKIKEIPYKELKDRGYINPQAKRAELVRQIYSFFGYVNYDELDDGFGKKAANYKISESLKIRRGALATWLRICEFKAENLETEAFNKQNFMDAIEFARKNIVYPLEECFPKLRKRFRNAGVALVVEPGIRGAPLDGAAMWVKQDKAILMLSGRYKRDDLIWFTLFHEAAHLLLHGRKNIFIDDLKKQTEEKKEKEIEANKFAENILIKPKVFEEFKVKGDITEKGICNFACAMKVTPGIIVGRLQNQNVIHWRHPLNCLKEPVDPAMLSEL